jgi:glycosyltransferase involved in cell wall biosynthesis
VKICIINSLYTPYYRGGAELVVKKDVDRLKSYGHEVFVITVCPWEGRKSMKPKIDEIEGVKIYRFYPFNLFSFVNINKKPMWLRLPWHFFDIFNIHSYFTVKKILQREKTDLVLTHNLKGIGYTVWRAIKDLKIKNTHIIHDVQLVVPSGLLLFGREKIVNGIFYKIYSATCRLLINSPDEVISPSRWLLDFYTQRGFFKDSKKIVNLAFGALPEVKQLNLEPQKETIKLIYVGQIEDHKGVVWLVEILKKIETDKLRNWKLDIIGDGTKLADIKKLVIKDKRVTIYGRVEGRDRDELIKQTDFVVVPSLCYENSPTIISVALGLGIPVLAAKIGGIPEMVKEGVDGWLFTPNNSNDFLEKIFKF